MSSMSSANSRHRDWPFHETLSQLQGNVVLPSTLDYKERTKLQQKDAFEYGRIYNHTYSRGLNVYDRLTADAAVRQTLRAAKAPAAKDTTASSDSFAAMAQAASVSAAATSAAGTDKSSRRNMTGIVSGYVHNNNPAMTCKQQAAQTACSNDPPLSALHPITLRSYYKKFPLDLLAAARPQARTTNETLRILGTYQQDQALAERLGVHVPHGCASLQAPLQTK